MRAALAAYYGMVSFLDDNIGRILNALGAAGLADDTLAVYTSDHGDNLGTRTFWGKSNMYDEAVGVPLILTGPGIPAGRRVKTPVSLVDCFPTILEGVGESLSTEDRALPGTSLLRLLNDEQADRIVFSEYHAVGSLTGTSWSARPLQICPLRGLSAAALRPRGGSFEKRDLALEPGHDAILAEGEQRLRAICDPSAVTERAFADQQRQIDEFGGQETVLKRGSYPYTPAPGEAPRYA